MYNFTGFSSSFIRSRLLRAAAEDVWLVMNTGLCELPPAPYRQAEPGKLILHHHSLFIACKYSFHGKWHLNAPLCRRGLNWPVRGCWCRLGSVPELARREAPRHLSFLLLKSRFAGKTYIPLISHIPLDASCPVLQSQGDLSSSARSSCAST